MCMMSTDNNSKGILLIIAAMTLFAMQDSLIKFIFEKAALYEIFFGRYFVAAIIKRIPFELLSVLIMHLYQKKIV